MSAETITMTPEALVDLLTTTACLGRDLTGGTREDAAKYLATFGFKVGERRLVEAVENAERVAQYLASVKE